MIAGKLALAGGIAGAVALSQFPEFSQQYLQRLAGQVDALTRVEADFDRTATQAGYTRDQALAELSGAGFIGAQGDMMRTTFARLDGLSADLAALRGAGVVQRLTMPHHLADPELLQATWGDFKPAVPVTVDGAISAALGYGLGWGLVVLLLGLPRRLFARRKLA